MALVSIAELEAKLGFTVDPTQAQSVIDDVSAIIIDYVNDATVTDTWGETTTPDGVQAVAKEVVRRGLVNPDARSNQSLDDHSWQTPMGSAGIYLAPKEKKTIRQAIGRLGVDTQQLEGYLPLDPIRFPEDDLVL